MTTRVEKSIEVSVPVSTAYNQWTQFEEFPHFMGGVKKVTQLDDKHLQWVAEIAGVKREWTATILEQIPDEKVAWAATDGATNAGAVHFRSTGPSTTSVQLVLEYAPEGLVEKVGDALNIVEKQAEGDLERFKAFIEDAGYATGAWRGAVNEGAGVGTPGVEAAAASEGDSGKAGVSAKAVVAGAAAAAVGVAAASVLKGGSDEETTTVETTTTTTPAPDAVIATEVVEEAPLSSEDLAAPTTDFGIVESTPRTDTAAMPVDAPIIDTDPIDTDPTTR
jgi:hypothetical protein